MTSPNSTNVVSYSCPGCGTALEAHANRPPTWQRCPRCGRASLPPEIVTPRPVPKEPPVLGTFVTAPPRGPRERRRPFERYLRPNSPRDAKRVVLATGVYVCSLLMIYTLLEQNAIGSTVFALLALCFLLTLARPRRRYRGGRG